MRQIFGDIGWEKKLLAFFGAIALFVLLGPFGTYGDLTFWERSVFWVMIVGGIGFFMHITMSVALVTRYLGALPQLLRLLIGAIFGAFPGAAIVFFVNGVFRPPMMDPDVVPVIWIQVVAIGFLIGVFEYIDWYPRDDKSEPDTPKPQATRLHARLNAAPNTEIISMSMQDHYVEVTTSEGTEMVLMRFADAIEAVSDLPGSRIHRSHWVAHAHLQTVEKRNQRATATLRDGRTLAVSNTYLDEVEAVLNARSS